MTDAASLFNLNKLLPAAELMLVVTTLVVHLCVYTGSTIQRMSGSAINGCARATATWTCLDLRCPLEALFVGVLFAEQELTRLYCFEKLIRKHASLSPDLPEQASLGSDATDARSPACFLPLRTDEPCGPL